MPNKSVREMSEWELRRNSLGYKVFRSTLFGALALGLVALVVGLGLYTWSLVQQYIRESFSIARSVAASAEKWIDQDILTDEVMNVFRSMTDEELAATDTEPYRARFAHVEELSQFQSMRKLLGDYLGSSDMNDLYFGVYDRSKAALVYICDPDTNPETLCYPGDWDALNQRELNRFLEWDGTGKLYTITYTKRWGWICTGAYPVRLRDETISGFIMADITLGEVWKGMKVFLLQYTLAMLAITLVVGFVMTRHMKKRLVMPITDIAVAAGQYATDHRGGIQGGNHFSRLSIRTGDEVENLSLVMADMERDLNDYEENLKSITAEKERINTELALATRIQADMLPSIFPPYPERTDMDIYALMDPAKEVGGDFYDFFLLDQDHLGLVMADVSGKGIPAALFMTVSMILVQNYAMTGLSPAKVLEAMNHQICSNNREQMFVTVWFGILDLRDGTLTAANAGHEYPVLRKPGGPFELMKDRHGFVIGGMDGIRYKEYTLQLEPGASLFLYTDGVPEAANDAREFFGIDRMLGALNSAGETSAEGLLAAVRKSVDGFVGSAPQFDDMTMLCITYLGQKPAEGGQP